MKKNDSINPRYLNQVWELNCPADEPTHRILVEQVQRIAAPAGQDRQWRYQVFSPSWAVEARGYAATAEEAAKAAEEWVAADNNAALLHPIFYLTRGKTEEPSEEELAAEIATEEEQLTAVYYR